MMVLRLKLTLACIFLYTIGFTQKPLDSFMKNQLAEKKFPVYDSLVKEYKVTRIKQIENAYIIDLTDNEKYMFTIISLKKEKEKRSRIRKGKKYEFLLYSYYDPNVIRVGKDPTPKKLIIKGTIVSFMTDFKNGIIVTTPNLEGLYYTSINEMKNE